MPWRSPWIIFVEKPLEWGLTAYLIGWAVTLVLSPNTLTRDVYSAFVAAGLTEGQIIAFCFAIGGMRFAVLFMNGYAPHGPLFRQLCAGLSAIGWFQVSLMLALPTINEGIGVKPLTFGVIQYAITGVLELCSIRIAANDGRYRVR